MSLNTLKVKLQECLNESTESEDWQEALRDSIYACELMSETALRQHIDAWSEMGTWDVEYLKGLHFVADIWDKIKGE